MPPRPARGAATRIRRPRRAAVAPRAPTRHSASDASHGRLPASASGTKYHHAPVAPMLVGEEALEVLVDEEERQELAVRARDRDEPGRRQREEDARRPDTRCEPPPQRVVAAEQRNTRQRAPAGSTRPIGPLDNVAPASAAQREPHPRAPRASCPAPARCATASAPNAIARKNASPASSDRICAMPACHSVPARATAANAPSAGPPSASPGDADGRHGEQAGERRPQPRRPLVDAERAVTRPP